jgi:hypothetical protein
MNGAASFINTLTSVSMGPWLRGQGGGGMNGAASFINTDSGQLGWLREQGGRLHPSTL